VIDRVKLCLNTITNRLCALKCINRKMLRRKYAAQGPHKGREAVKTEIAIMKKLTHENVVRLYEVIDDEVSRYIFMVLEYIPGGPIYDPEKFQQKGMGEELAKHYFRETCCGLDFMHVNNVIHRDLKPDNLLKMTDGTVKITDFGVSELFSGDDDDGLEVSAAVGTPAFLPPEIAKGGKARGKPSDVWSLGVCLFYIVCGQLPFSGETLEHITTAIRNDDVIIPDTMSPALGSLLLGILDKNPETRMTLEQIMMHGWVTDGVALPISASNSTRNMVLVSQMEVNESISKSGVRGFFSKAAESRTYQPGEYVIRQGDLGTDMFVIESGKVEVVTLKEQENDGESDAEDFSFDTLDDITSAAMMNKIDRVDSPVWDSCYLGVQMEVNKDVGCATTPRISGSVLGGRSSDGGGGQNGRTDSAKGFVGVGCGGFFARCFGRGGGVDGDIAGRGGGSGGDVLPASPNSSRAKPRKFTSLNAIVAERSAGDFIGEISLLSLEPRRRSASVRAVVETRCCIISRDAVMKSLQDQPEMLEELRLSADRRESELLMGQVQLKVGVFDGPPELIPHRTQSFSERVAHSRLTFDLRHPPSESIPNSRASHTFTRPPPLEQSRSQKRRSLSSSNPHDSCISPSSISAVNTSWTRV